MTNQQPTYLWQGVNYVGFLSQQLGDLSGKTTLAHELIQNADDAKDDSGNLAATRITFDVTDTALIVSNDAAFREIDFDRMRDVASGSKRSESGDRTTGAFGVGFISVYQVTDRPEIHSAGRIWILNPDNPDARRRIQQWEDPSTAGDKGTVFRLPWAFEESPVRKALKTPAVDTTYIKSFVNELAQSLPRQLSSLKNWRESNCIAVEACRVVTRRIRNDTRIVRDGEVRCWVFWKRVSLTKPEAENRTEAASTGRSDRVRIAVQTLDQQWTTVATCCRTRAIRPGCPFHCRTADFFHLG